MLVPNRELSQFAQYLSVEDSGNRNIGIATTGAPFVGIGTTNPTSKFFVNGNAAITGVLTASNFRGSSQIGITSGGTYVGLTTNINFVGSGVTITSQYNSTLGITTFTFSATNGSSPGGAESQVQYFSAGTFAGSPNFTFNGTGVNIAGITTASRFISTVTNGTAPLSVASSTIVTNLNADFLEGYNPATPNNANTIVLRDVNGNFQAGFVTATGFIGSVFDANTSRITTIYGTNSYYTNGFIVVGIVTTLTNTNATLERVNISGIVTVGNNPVLIGLTTTGTQNQKLQVEGKGYFSDSVGIGSTNPSSRLSVVGDGAFSGILTASQLSSVIPQGTAPLSIASSTLVNNLNANYVEGYSSSFLLGRTNHIGVQSGSTISGAYVSCGMTLGSDTLLGRSSAGVGNVEEIVCTSAGRALLDDVSASAQRTTLQLGTAATMTGPSGSIVGTTDTQTLTNKTIGNLKETVFTITDGVSVSLDPANGPIQLWTLGANRSPNATNFTAGQSMLLMIDDGTARTITWPSVTWVGGSAPTLTTSGFTVIELWKPVSTLYGAFVGYVA
jgi:hypothetical protein